MGAHVLLCIVMLLCVSSFFNVCVCVCVCRNHHSFPGSLDAAVSDRYKALDTSEHTLATYIWIDATGQVDTCTLYRCRAYMYMFDDCVCQHIFPLLPVTCVTKCSTFDIQCIYMYMYMYIESVT